MSSHLLSHFRFGQTWSEAKTLQILFESYCVHSPTQLPSTSPRKSQFACHSSPPWNLPSFIVKFTISSPCSRYDPSLFRQDAALAHPDSLPPHDLVMWTDGSVRFSIGRGGSGVLADCSLCGAEAVLSFSTGPVCSDFFAEARKPPFCKLSAGLGSTNKSAFFLLLLSLSLLLCLSF